MATKVSFIRQRLAERERNPPAKEFLEAVGRESLGKPIDPRLWPPAKDGAATYAPVARAALRFLGRRGGDVYLPWPSLDDPNILVNKMVAAEATWSQLNHCPGEREAVRPMSIAVDLLGEGPQHTHIITGRGYTAIRGAFVVVDHVSAVLVALHQRLTETIQCIQTFADAENNTRGKRDHRTRAVHAVVDARFYQLEKLKAQKRDPGDAKLDNVTIDLADLHFASAYVQRATEADTKDGQERRELNVPDMATVYDIYVDPKHLSTNVTTLLGQLNSEKKLKNEKIPNSAVVFTVSASHVFGPKGREPKWFTELEATATKSREQQQQECRALHSVFSSVQLPMPWYALVTLITIGYRHKADSNKFTPRRRWCIVLYRAGGPKSARRHAILGLTRREARLAAAKKKGNDADKKEEEEEEDSDDGGTEEEDNEDEEKNDNDKDKAKRTRTLWGIVYGGDRINEPVFVTAQTPVSARRHNKKNKKKNDNGGAAAEPGE